MAVMAACNSVVHPFNELSPSHLWPHCMCVCMSGHLLQKLPLSVTLQWRASAAPCTSEYQGRACCPQVEGQWTVGMCHLLPQLPCWHPVGMGDGAHGVPCRQSAQCGSRPLHPHQWSCGRLDCRSSCSWWSCASSYATLRRLRCRPGRTPLWQR